jgi:hypothetical protein
MVAATDPRGERVGKPSPTSEPGPDDADRPEGGRRFPEEDYRPPPRRRTPPLQVLAMLLLSILVTGLLFRGAVEAVRHFVLS